jgi:putative nucleotidyltransferase with HDIG domain
VIDLIKAEKEFKEYTSHFKVADQKVNVKVKHTYGVVRAAEYIAKGLNLSDEDVELAKLIGLLHDIGRFEQAVRYDNYSDYDTMDHADFGVKLLFEDNLIREFIDDNQYDEIIKKAVANHNKFEIEKGLNDRELLHAKIIRDADKTDNFVIKQYQDFYSLFRATEEEVGKEKITDLVWQEFLSGKTIVTHHRKNNIDAWVSYLAWVYDYNFVPGLKYLKENDCIDKVIDRLQYQNEDTKEKMEYVRKVTKEYIEKRINE